MTARVGGSWNRKDAWRTDGLGLRSALSVAEARNITSGSTKAVASLRSMQFLSDRVEELPGTGIERPLGVLHPSGSNGQGHRGGPWHAMRSFAIIRDHA
jgi:hypothetical protein